MAYPGMIPPPINPREVRPSRVWYVVAATVAILGVAAGPILALVFFGTMFSLSKDIPAMTVEFDARTPATVRLTAARNWAVYAEVPSTTATPAPASERPVLAQCSVKAPGDGTAELTRVSYTFTTTLRQRSWRLIYELKVDRDGEYEVSCEPTDPAVETSRYAVGDDPDLGGILAKMLGSFGAGFGMFLIPCGGLVVGGLVVLVTAVRRSSNRNRLLRQRMGPPPGQRP